MCEGWREETNERGRTVDVVRVCSGIGALGQSKTSLEKRLNGVPERKYMFNIEVFSPPGS